MKLKKKLNKHFNVLANFNPFSINIIKYCKHRIYIKYVYKPNVYNKHMLCNVKRKHIFREWIKPFDDVTPMVVTK